MFSSVLVIFENTLLALVIFLNAFKKRGTENN